MNSPRKSPRRYTLGGLLIAGLAVAYTFLQPMLNERYGLNLPTLVAADDQQAVKTPPKPKSSASGNPQSSTEQPKPTQPAQASSTKTPPATKPADDPNLRYGILKDLGREEFISPAGLRYTRGSAEGHRLKHLERHTADQPTRPGKHGVFSGGMAGALKAIDEAYLKAKEGGRGVQREEDEGRVVYTVDLRRKIGFIGGEEGNRKNKPTAFKVRMVLDGDRVITAYPL